MIDEIKRVRTVLGENEKRKFGFHVQSAQELPVSCKNVGGNVVQYSIQNSSSKPQACVLYRGVNGEAPPYYFGNAFFAAYYGGINGTRVAEYYNSLNIKAPNPLNENAIYSLALLSTGTKEYLTCFVFMVPPKSTTFKILEGGIPDCALLQDVHAYLVTLADEGTYKQFFSQVAMRQYIAQTGYIVDIPKQDPYFAKTVSLNALEANIPTNEIFPNQCAEKVR